MSALGLLCWEWSWCILLHFWKPSWIQFGIERGKIPRFAFIIIIRELELESRDHIERAVASYTYVPESHIATKSDTRALVALSAAESEAFGVYSSWQCPQSVHWFSISSNESIPSVGYCFASSFGGVRLAPFHGSSTPFIITRFSTASRTSPSSALVRLVSGRSFSPNMRSQYPSQNVRLSRADRDGLLSEGP